MRKPNESGHSTEDVEGTLGRRWVFVDDFVSSGATLQRVIHAVNDNFLATCFMGVAEYRVIPTAKFHSRAALRRKAPTLEAFDHTTMPIGK